MPRVKKAEPEQPAKTPRARKPKAPAERPRVVEQLPRLKVHDVIRVKLKHLLADPGNPREISEADFEALIRSVGTFGLVEPFVARSEDKRIVGGHQRAKAVAEFLRRPVLDGQGREVERGATEEEIAEQEVTVAFVPGLSESKCRALNLALNRISGAFDFAVMPDYLAGIESGDLNLTGFLEDEVNDILHLGSMAPPPPGDPDQYLADLNLKFAFKVSTPEEASLVRATLTSYGATGPKDAGVAFVQAMQAAAKKKRPVAAE